MEFYQVILCSVEICRTNIQKSIRQILHFKQDYIFLDFKVSYFKNYLSVRRELALVFLSLVIIHE